LDAKEKGAMGETVVYREIVSMLGELDFECKVIQNARFCQIYPAQILLRRKITIQRIAFFLHIRP